ncbi:MAG: glycosyltransferase family 4 protein [Scytonematopsis contorta HA4267-MV1]|jgi:glycosyltransferase involved in cell wall biosynthesis|nr:glycosyltransferase family 4 protein [Scytonematopsis contorta HA4267-MV1]
MLKINNKLFTLKKSWQKLGAREFLSFFYQEYLKNKLFALFHSNKGKIDVVEKYNFVIKSPFGEIISNLNDINKKTVNWVIPDFCVGSGGHINIFRIIANLEKQGYECRIIIVGDCNFSSGDAAYQSICKHFNIINAQVTIGKDSMQPAWITIATSWITAYPVRDFRSTVIKCYFVQDFEPYFYPNSSEYIWAEETYRFSFLGITAGKWLADKLAQEYDMKTDWIGFSYDRHLYKPLARREPEKKQIFFYARHVTPRRGFEFGTLVLAEVARRLPSVKFILAGWDISSFALPFEYVNAGVLALEDLPDIYSQCDAALVLSFTNLSLLPLELMACGCPIVSNKGANVEWLLNDKNAVLCEPTIEALADALVDILQNEERRSNLIKAGLDFASKTNWFVESEKIVQIFERISYESQ